MVTFDNAGVGGSAGITPDTIEQMARDAIAFLPAMQLGPVNLLGFSIGSLIAQQIALTRPAIVCRLVLASSAPQGAAGMHGWAPEIIGVIGTPHTSPEASPARTPAGTRVPERCGACTPGPKTGTRPRRGRPARPSTTRCELVERAAVGQSGCHAAVRVRRAPPQPALEGAIAPERTGQFTAARITLTG